MGFLQKTKCIVKNQSLFSLKWCIDYNTWADLFILTFAWEGEQNPCCVTFTQLFSHVWMSLNRRFMKEVGCLPQYLHGEGWLYKEFISISWFLIVTLTIGDKFLGTWRCLGGSFFSIRDVVPGRREILLSLRSVFLRICKCKEGNKQLRGEKGLLFKFHFPNSLGLQAPLSLGAHQLFFLFPLAKLTQQVWAEFVSNPVLLSCWKSLWEEP